MKNLIYEKPLLFLTGINLFFLLVFILLIKKNLPVSMPTLGFLAGLLNNKILKKANNLTNKNKSIFISLFSICMILVVTYSFYN